MAKDTVREPSHEEIQAARTAPFRLLPQDAEAEQGVLASLLLSPENVAAICAERGASPDWFHVPAHAILFTELMFLVSERMPVDYITVCNTLKSTGHLEECGGAPFITHIATLLPTAANVGRYLEILREKYVMRRIVALGTSYATKGYDAGEEAETLLDQFEAEVLRIRGRVQGLTTKTASQCVEEAMIDVLWRLDNPRKIQGLSTGFPLIDTACDGLHPQEFFVLAARPGLGKTALALQIIEHLTLTQRQPCALFSLEMSRRQLFARQIFSHARVNWMKVRDRGADAGDRQRLDRSKDALRSMNLVVEDKAGMSIQEFRGVARRLVQKGCKAIFVDSMSAMRSDSKEAQHKRDRSVAECCAGFKAAAKELNIPIVVLCHLKREVDKSDGPTLSDLRESGSIEQDADTVCMMDQQWTEGVPEIPAVLTFPKQRYGEKNARVEMTFQKAFVRFSEPDRATEEQSLL